MPAAGLIIAVTLPLMTTLLLTGIWMLIHESEGRRYDRKVMSLLRDHLLKARDVLVGMEARGSSIDPHLAVFRAGRCAISGAESLTAADGTLGPPEGDPSSHPPREPLSRRWSP